MIELQVKRYAALCQLRWLVMSLPAAEFEKIVVVFGQDWCYGLELNSKGNNFSFICCAKQRTILLGVPLAWRALHDQRLSDLEWSFFSMITTCDRSANSTFLVTRGSCSAVSKGVVHS